MKDRSMMGPGNVPCFCHYLRTMRISRLVLLVAAFLLSVTFVSYYFVNRIEAGNKAKLEDDPSNDAVRRMLGLIDVEEHAAAGPELKRRTEELLRIKASVQKELRSLEQKRSEMQRQVRGLETTIADLKTNADKQRLELEKMRVSLEQARTARIELAERNTPELRPPLRILAKPDKDVIARQDFSHSEVCSFGACFDLSRCSLSSEFPVFFYNNLYGWTSTKDGFGYKTNRPEEACLFVASYDPASGLTFDQFKNKFLSHWNGDGRNHVVIDVSISEQESSGKQVLNPQISDIGRSAFVSSTLFDGSLRIRPGFDLAVPPFKHMESPQDLWTHLPSLLPVRRKFILSYQGNLPVSKVTQDTLEHINNDQTDDKASLDFNSSGNQEQRSQILLSSTFNLIITDEKLKTNDISSTHRRLTEALEAGAIPVFLCKPDCVETKILLPFSEVIQWERAAIFVPLARVTELHFLLRSFPDSDLFSLKKQGRMLWQNYLGSGPALMSAILNTLRWRIGIPAAPVKEEKPPSVFNKTLTESVMPEQEPQEFLGPLEPPTASSTFRRNFSSLINGGDDWNVHFMDASKMPPSNPWEPILPAEAKFLGSALGYRPINYGEGGSGKEFSQALGGNVPSEQFTVVMLTYEREPVLKESLARLYGLPYLNKVIVVWNSELPPSPDMTWPEIGVPVEVLRTSKNSLNNRFLPYESIETEAVLSVDDDAHLRHDEIIFGFRVWRENRNRLVGFPGRYHAWDRENFSWNYNSNYSCELSMVLTGAAFYHKYYSYAYTHIMPTAIRDMIDEFMNCEDLAMNFLISHMTRQPPVKVTSRWTFRCPGCPVTLSEDDSHFQERHRCINFFTKVYGYNPLLYTQYRADSVLFKTRIAQDKQKCFKYI